MKIPDKNRVCFFCAYALTIHNEIVWCGNKKKIRERREAKYGTHRVSMPAGEASFSFYSCDGFEEAEGATTKIVKMKLTGKYRSRDHERETGGRITSG